MVEDEKTEVPLFGVLVSAVLGLLFLLPFPSWSKLVNVVTGAAVLMYAGAPLSLGALRRSRPGLERPYRLPAARLVAPASFIFATFIVYWSGWQTVSTLMLALLLGYGLMWLARRLRLDQDPPPIEWASARWLFPYLVGIIVVSYLGNFGAGGILGGVGPFKDVLVGRVASSRCGGTSAASPCSASPSTPSPSTRSTAPRRDQHQPDRAAS